MLDNIAVEKHLLVPDTYEPEVENVINRFVKPGDCVIDVGASIGFFTVMMSKIVGENGLVLAFEPHQESFQHLYRNVHFFHKLNNVALFRHALWKHDVSALELWSVNDIGYSSFHAYKDAEYSEFTEGRALDTLLSEKDHPRFMKIDCEGTEAEVLCGAHKILERGVDCIVLEFNFHLMFHTGRTTRAIRDYMRSLGYDMFVIDVKDDSGEYVVPIKIAHDAEFSVTGKRHWINVMFSTEEKVVARW
jgi:FkbM family methyltransferase